MDFLKRQNQLFEDSKIVQKNLQSGRLLVDVKN